MSERLITSTNHFFQTSWTKIPREKENLLFLPKRYSWNKISWKGEIKECVKRRFPTTATKTELGGDSILFRKHSSLIANKTFFQRPVEYSLLCSPRVNDEKSQFDSVEKKQTCWLERSSFPWQLALKKFPWHWRTNIVEAIRKKSSAKPRFLLCLSFQYFSLFYLILLIKYVSNN